MLFSTSFTKFVTEAVNPKVAGSFVSKASKVRAITATATAAAGDFMRLNTIGAGVPGSGIIVTMPASPSVGDTVYFFDAGQNLANKPVTISGNGKNIMGKAETLVLDVNGANVALSYVDTNVGWEIVGNAEFGAGSVVLVSPDGSRFILSVADNATLTASKLV